MQLFQRIKKSWGEVRWKMLIIFAFFSVISTLLVTCFSIAVLNVVVRRESSYLIEERINGIVDSCKRLTSFLLERVHGCQTPAINSPLFTEYPGAVWPGAQTLVAVLPKGGASHDPVPKWIGSSSFAGVVVDRGSLEIRSLRKGCMGGPLKT
jgi:hypothetical protein